MKKYLIFILWTVIWQVKSDLPINCYNSQITGKWTFKPTKMKEQVYRIENSCGHLIPDNQNSSYKASIDASLFQDHQIFEMDLKEDGQIEYYGGNRAIDTLISLGINNKNIWTMVYNEGFEIKFKGIVILLFNKYQQVDDGFQCNCAKTLVGWIKNEVENKYGCIVGWKSDGVDLINDSNVQGNIVLQGKIIPKQPQMVVQQNGNNQQNSNDYQNMFVNNININMNQFSFRFKEQIKNRFKKFQKNNMQMKSQIRMDLQFRSHQKVVERINQMKGITWTAQVNKVFQNKTIKQINRLSGRFKKRQPKKIQQFKNKEEYYKLDEKVAKLFKNDELQYLKHFDWSEKIGYMSKSREQKDCGSCYVIATMSMIDFRLRIKMHRQKKIRKMLKLKDQKLDAISVQHAMDCNYYNQGCDGGYSMLVGKFGEEQLLIEEKYKPYKAKDQKCSNIKHIDKIKYVVKVKDYGYVGGRYSNCNHYNIMKEVKENGPVVLSFSPDDSFQYYSSGIYQSIEPLQWISQNIQRPEWTAIDHSVLVYGWGEENGIYYICYICVKYWLCQNSWGEDFGIKGSFKIKRGEDTMGIESSAEYVDPYLETIETMNNKDILNRFKLV